MRKTQFAAALEQHGDRIALVDDNGAAPSFATLAALADRIAQGTGPARLGLIEMGRNVDAIAAYLGALRHNLPVILTAPDQQERTADLIQRFQPDCLFRDGQWSTLSADPWHTRMPHPDLALLLSTSGSTGDPRLVRLSHGNIEANAEAIAAYLGLRASDRAITSLPLHHAFGLSVLHAQLAAGGSLVATREAIGSPAFRALCDHYRCTVLASVPHGYDLLEQSGFMEDCPSSLRILQVAGGRMAPDAVMRWARWARAGDRRFFVMYGQTEAAPRMAWLPPEQALVHPDCIGRPIRGGSFSLRDEHGLTISGNGIAGELVYRGANVMMGYADSRDDLALRAGPAVLRTGDIAERVADDMYRIVGRSRRFVKPFGLRVSLDRIEQRLRGAAAAGDDRLIAVRSPTGDPRAITDDLAVWLGLPPTIFAVTIGPVPRLDNGKPDYRAVIELAREGSEIAATETHPVAQLCEAITGNAVADARASFASMGGDSLSRVHAMLQIEALVGRPLPPDWETMPLRDIMPSLAATAPTRTHLICVDTELVLRALAMIEIVFLHAHLFHVAGGAELLLFLSGISFYRLRRIELREGRIGSTIWPFMRSFILPYYLLLLIWCVVRGEIDLPRLLLVGNYLGKNGTLLEPYWFLEALLQCLVATALLTRLPIVRRSPMRAITFLVLIGIAARLASAPFEPHQLGNRTLECVFYLFAGGMMFAAIRGKRSPLPMVAILLALSVLSWGPFDTHLLWIAGACALLIALPHMSLPRPVATSLTAIASASFHINLTHGVVIWFVTRWVAWQGGLVAALSALLVGLWLHRLDRHFRRRG